MLLNRKRGCLKITCLLDLSQCDKNNKQQQKDKKSDKFYASNVALTPLPREQ